MNCEAKVLINALKQSNQLLNNLLTEDVISDLQQVYIKQRIAVNNNTIQMCPTESEVLYA